MSCFACFGSSKKEVKHSDKEEVVNDDAEAQVNSDKSRSGNDSQKEGPSHKEPNTSARIFTFHELAAVTEYFKPEFVLGEGGFGRVYRGRLESTGQTVAVKQLDRNGLQGNREFTVEVDMLSTLHHPNLVKLVGYCADGDQRLVVYEYMPLGSLEDHLHDLAPDKEPLDWSKRMKIAAGAARGLAYLHDTAKPPVIYRDLKSSNILLDAEYFPKLSDFGLAKLGPVGDQTHVTTRVMGTYGYCAPEYAMTGQLTLKSDIYGFGVVLLEILTGRRAIDNRRSAAEQNLVAWARPLFKDRKEFPSMADPLLQGRYPLRGLYQALAVAAMCLQEQAALRPVIADIVNALTYLESQRYDPNQSRGGSSREDPGRGGSQNLPDVRKRESVGDINETGASSGHGSQRESAGSAGGTRGTSSNRDRDLERERALADAKSWGRDKKQTNAPGDDACK